MRAAQVRSFALFGGVPQGSAFIIYERRYTMKQAFRISLALLLLCALALPVSAAPRNARAAALSWLQKEENTQFDYTQTDYPDSLADWTAFTLAQCGVQPDARYKDYLTAVVQNSLETLYPSDVARLVLAAKAIGSSPQNIGGHDLLAALRSVDYASQIYVSSLAFPLLAMDFDASFPFTDSDRAPLLEALCAAQQPDGGFPYCTEDQGYGISSDCDTTAMAVQALAPYREKDETVRGVLGRALDYLKAQQFESGAFGTAVFGTPSGESTAQVILALCALGLDPADPEFCKNGVSPVDALEAYLSEAGGGLNYAGAEDPLTTYQIAQALEAYRRLQAGEPTLFTFTGAPGPSEPGTQAPQPETPTGEQPASPVEIPKTGGAAPAAAAGLACLAAAVLLGRRRHV